jgi:hypothetical protein
MPFLYFIVYEYFYSGPQKYKIQSRIRYNRFNIIWVTTIIGNTNNNA